MRSYTETRGGISFVFLIFKKSIFGGLEAIVVDMDAIVVVFKKAIKSLYRLEARNEAAIARGNKLMIVIAPLALMTGVVWFPFPGNL